MKKIFFISTLVILICGISCKKKNSSSSYTPDCSGTTPKFAADVSSVISSNCATSGCHAAGSGNGPGALTTYAQIKNAASQVRSSVVNGSMPQNGSLTTAQKNTIVCWIDAGATNN